MAMTDEHEVGITIKGKNLTPEAFAAARRELAGLGDETEKLKTRTKPATDQTNMFADSWKNLTAGFTAANLIENAARGMVTLAKEVLHNAGTIDDLSKKLGVSVEAIQRWEYAAKLGGQSIDTVDRALSFMNKTLAGGSSSTVKALEAAGLQFNAVRALRSEDAFETIAAAIAEIPDPMERARLAMVLFGKSGQELLPAIRDGFVEVGREAKVMSQEQINSLNQINDAYDKAGATAKHYFGLTLLFQIQEIEHIKGGFKALNGYVDETAEMQRDAAKDVQRMTDALLAQNVRTHEGAKGLELLAGVEKQLTAELKAATDAQDRYISKLRDMADVMTGKKLASEVKDIAAAVELAGGSSKITASELDRLGKQLSDMQSRGATLPPTLKAIADNYANANMTAIPLVTSTHNLAEVLGLVKGIAIGLPPLAPTMTLPTKEVTADMVLSWQADIVASMDRSSETVALSFSDNFGNMLTTELPKALMGAIQGGGNVYEAGGAVIGSFLMSDKGIGDNIKKGATDLFGPKLGGAIASALPGLGALVTPALGAIINKIFGSAGRDAVKEFADKLGGFDALREKLLPLGDVGEKLWVNLTQGVGKNNPEQAKAAIKAVQDALGDLDRQSETLSKYNILWYELGQTARDAKLKELIEELVNEQEAMVAAGVPVEVALKRQAGAYNEILANALKSGIEIPASLLPTISRLAEMHELTEANVRALLGLSADTRPGIEDMRKAADDLGISYEHLGDRFRRMDLEEQGNRYAAAFARLVDGSADAVVIVDKMSEDSKKAINEYLRMGAEVPEAWRPLLEAMHKQGELTDENGEKLKDLSGIKFAKPLTESMGELVDKIAELIAKLSGEDGLMGSIGKLPREIDIDFNFNGRKSGEWPGVEEGKGGGFESPAFASGGIAEGPMYARIERGRKEIIGDVDFMARALDGALQRRGMAGVAGGGGQPIQIVLTNYLDTGEFLNERIINVVNRGHQTNRIQVPRENISERFGRTSPGDRHRRR